jgi:hypothetical protein
MEEAVHIAADRVLGEMDSVLTRKEEVIIALDQKHFTKAPRPDSKPALFFNCSSSLCTYDSSLFCS